MGMKISQLLPIENFYNRLIKSFNTPTAKSLCLVTFGKNYECLNLSTFTHPVVFIDSFIMELKVLPNTNQASILMLIILMRVGGGRGRFDLSPSI